MWPWRMWDEVQMHHAGCLMLPTARGMGLLREVPVSWRLRTDPEASSTLTWSNMFSYSSIDECRIVMVEHLCKPYSPEMLSMLSLDATEVLAPRTALMLACIVAPSFRSSPSFAGLKVGVGVVVEVAVTAPYYLLLSFRLPCSTTCCSSSSIPSRRTISILPGAMSCWPMGREIPTAPSCRNASRTAELKLSQTRSCRQCFEQRCALPPHLVVERSSTRCTECPLWPWVSITEVMPRSTGLFLTALLAEVLTKTHWPRVQPVPLDSSHRSWCATPLVN